MHPWLKYPKFGHQSVTDYTSRMIRYGMLTRDEAIKIIKEKEHKLDQLVVRDFCEFCGYTEQEFWLVVDKLYNLDFFVKKDEKWVLKKEIT